MADDQKALVIVANPTSGKGRGKKRAEELAALLVARGIDAQIRWTDAKGHAEKLAAEAVSAGTDIVVASGGDGTIQEVANALAEGPATMGLLPAGRCNDFARALGLKKDIEQAADIIAGGNTRAMDLGRIGERYFCTIAALGFDAAVSRWVDDKMRMPLKGTPAYLYATVRVLMHYRPIEVKMTGDFGTFEGPVFLAANANTSSYGGAIYIAPDARPDDGLLDICLIKPASKFRILRLLPSAMKGNHRGVPEVEFLRTKTLEIETAEPAEVWADGEPVGTTPIKLETIPGALNVLLPEADE